MVKNVEKKKFARKTGFVVINASKKHEWPVFKSKMLLHYKIKICKNFFKQNLKKHFLKEFRKLPAKVFRPTGHLQEHHSH